MFTKEAAMSGIGKYKLSDAMPKPSKAGKKRGKPETPHQVTAEPVREANESQSARNAEASNRDHMVDIGRGNQQAGRQGS
jgi:hypothetical protein